jgi:hypothetical protein
MQRNDVGAIAGALVGGSSARSSADRRAERFARFERRRRDPCPSAPLG